MEGELKVGEKAASQNGKQCDRAIVIGTSVPGSWGNNLEENKTLTI